MATTRRAWASSATEEARADITAAVQRLEEAQPALRAAQQRVSERINARNEVLRQHYAAGVDVRDLRQLVIEAGEDISLSHIKRLVAGARPSSPGL